VKFDQKLAKAIYEYQIKWLNTNREYLEFFGGNLLGVQVIHFKTSDVVKFFDMLDVDYEAIKVDTLNCKNVNPTFKVQSDTLNITLMYLLHRFLTAPTISDTVRKRACHDISLVFFYRCIAALLSDYFHYPADPKVAQAAYARLSGKYLIKQLGSWHKVMEYRAEYLTSHVKHMDALRRFNQDLDVLYVISDSQGSVRSLVKYYYAEFKEAHDANDRIYSSGATIADLDGDGFTKELTHGVGGHVEYIKQVVLDQHSFVKDDLVSVIYKLNQNSSTRMIHQTLVYICEHYYDQKLHAEIDELLTKTVIHSFHLLSDNKHRLTFNDYPKMLVTLKNLHLSTRSSDEDLMRIREICSKLVSSAGGAHISDSLLLSTRTAVLLYIFLRTVSGR
jgi:hypothetical protein